MVQMIQLTRGQEETLDRLVTALEQIAQHTRLIAANTDKMVNAITKLQESPLSPHYQHRSSFGPDNTSDDDLPF